VSVVLAPPVADKPLAAAPRALAMLAVAIALAIVASGYGVRFGTWDLRSAFAMLRWGAYAEIAIAAIALVLMMVPRARAHGVIALGVALVVAGVAGVVPLAWMQGARALPPVNDISTDTANPPAFVAILPLRAKATVPANYPGHASADLQRQAYPDIVPVTVADPPTTAFSKALAVARSMDWIIVASDAPAGRIEATATTPWFGFHDDVVIRVVPDGRGSRVDIRSVSRIGRGDFGTNAARVREFAVALAARSAR
jgi:uncharacterized protein (DUF1499 family)